MKTITLIIEGMMCQNCRSHVDKALNGISGVAAHVSLEEKKAVCTVEDGVSADTLKAAVEDAGYTCLLYTSYPKVLKAVQAAGYQTLTCDTSEYKKIDGGLSCLSLRF